MHHFDEQQLYSGLSHISYDYQQGINISTANSRLYLFFHQLQKIHYDEEHKLVSQNLQTRISQVTGDKRTGF